MKWKKVCLNTVKPGLIITQYWTSKRPLLTQQTGIYNNNKHEIQKDCEVVCILFAGFSLDKMTSCGSKS